MPKKVKPIPDNYPAVTPYLIIAGAAKALDFYRRIFGAKVRMRIPAPGGKIGHAEIDLGGSVVMVSDEAPEMGARAPGAFGGSATSLHLYVKDVDRVVSRAVKAGAKLVQPVQDKFYGDRSAMIVDPFGHSWSIATHIEDVSPKEIAKRMKAFASQGCA